MRKSIFLFTFVSVFIILVMPTISAVEHDCIVEHSRFQIIENYEKISIERIDISEIQTYGIVLNLITYYFKICIVVFVIWTLYDIMFQRFNLADSIKEAFRFAILWPWALLVFIMAEIFDWGPFQIIG